jgi:ankyrin repeat protein
VSHSDPLEAFVEACRSGKGRAEDYLDALTDLEAKSSVDHTPLGSTTFHRKYALAKELLRRGANPNALYANDRSPLFGAVAGRNLEMARLLLDAGADPDRGIPRIGHTPLQRAALTNEFLIVRLLVERGADVNVSTLAPNRDFPCATEHGGETPLHYAAKFASAEVIRFLIERGANPSLRNRNGESPLDWARADKREQDIVALLEVTR